MQASTDSEKSPVDPRKLASIQEIFRKLSRAKEKSFQGRCMHWNDGCSEPIGSHLISECVLRLISESGHLMEIKKPSITEIKKHHPELPSPICGNIGCGRASVFPGFCVNHENSLFREIDSVEMVPNEKTCSLLAYRTICESMITKYQVVSVFLDLIKESDPPEWFSAYGVREMKRCIELVCILNEIKADIDEGKFNFFGHLVFRMSPQFHFAASGAFIPYVDANCRPLAFQSSWIAMNMIPQKAGGLALFSWPRKGSSSCSRLIKSITKIPDSHFGGWLEKFALEHVERIYFSPEWWEGQTHEKQKNLLDRSYRSYSTIYLLEKSTVPSNLFSHTSGFISPYKVEERLTIC